MALVIGLFVVSALYTLFNGQVKAFMYQDQQMEMHQSARLGIDILSRTGRLAGYGTGGETRGVWGTSGNNSNELPAVIAYNGIGDNGSDAVTLVSMDPALVLNTAAAAPPSCGTTSLTFNPSVLQNATKLAQFQSGEMVMCYDYAALGGFRSWLWVLSAAGDAVTGTLTVTSNSGYADYDTDCEPTENLPLVMSCSRGEVATFYIDADDTDGIGAGSADHPVLMMDLDFESPDADDVPLVDNVEDLQVAYCLQATSGDTDCTDDTAWVDTITDAEVADLYMMRFSIVVRSPRPDLRDAYLGQRPALEDNLAASGTDNYYRQVITNEVVVRNMRIQSVL